MESHPQSVLRRVSCRMVVTALLVGSMFSGKAMAQERKFLVILANMPRSFPDEPSPTGVELPPNWEPGMPPIPMPNLGDIERVYFSTDPDDDVGSMTEYWEEISCGIVRITGKGVGTVELPWPQYPVQANDTTTSDMVENGDIEEDFSPATASDGAGYFNLNLIGDFQFGAGERVREFPTIGRAQVLYNTDFNNTAGSGDIPGRQLTFADNAPEVLGDISEDLDGDGKVDLGVEDLDMDLNPDFINEDKNNNCILDFVSEDDFCGNGDGVWDPATEDCNGNGQGPDLLSEDVDNDGHLDAGEKCLRCLQGFASCLKCGAGGCAPCSSPNDPDCHPDVNCDGRLADNEDLDADGSFDIANEDTNGNCTCQAYGTSACAPDVVPGYEPRLPDPIFTPGERFRDLDSDGYFDALFEPATIADFDGDDEHNLFASTNVTLIDEDDFNDPNGDGNRDFPEPLEDFLVMKIGNLEDSPQYGPVSPEYIRNNYPGNVNMLINRMGNNSRNKQVTGQLVYDAPDFWIDVQTADGAAFESYRKLELDSLQPSVPGHTVPRPSWLEDFWRARYGNAAADELINAYGDDMGWPFSTPNLSEFVPPEESTAGSIEYAFRANRGGTDGWGTVLEQMIHLHAEHGVFDIRVPPPVGPTFEDLGLERDNPTDGDEEGLVFDYNGTLHRYAYLENPGFPPAPDDDNSLSVEMANDYIFRVADDGRAGCIMPNGAQLVENDGCCDDYVRCRDPGCDCVFPAGTWGCDFDMDGDEGEVGEFGMSPEWLPAALPGQAGGMQDFDGDGEFDDFMFNPCAEFGMKHPDCPPPACPCGSGDPDCISEDQICGNCDGTWDPGVPPFGEDCNGSGAENCWIGGDWVATYQFPFSATTFFPETTQDCACVAFNVGDQANGVPDFNARCRPNGCWIDPDTNLCRDETEPGPNDPPLPDPVDCFVPRCVPDLGGSPYYPIPKFTEPAAPRCDVPFAIRWGNGQLLEDPPGNWPEGDDDDDILPPADLVYDGPKEYDDLASSFYHTRWRPGNAALDEPVAVLRDYGGDQSFGEVTTTSPDVANRHAYGHDKASLGSAGLSFTPDGTIVPAGPLAGGDTQFYGPNGSIILGYDGNLDVIHGGPGFDGGNQLVIEYMSRRTDGKGLTDPLCGPGTTDGRGFRDFNLDGMVDLGEGRAFGIDEDGQPFGTENYVIDSFDFTRNDGMDATAYPFNRNRLTEDVIEAVDFVEDFDTWINTFGGCGGSRFIVDINHIIFLPEGLPSTTPFAVFSPDPGSLGVVNTVDDMPPQANQRVRLQDMLQGLTFTNLAASLDRNGETDQALETNASFNVAFNSHEFGHYWECWPDLYDYDTFDGFQNEHPVAQWDLMSGSAAGQVHVIPVYKENSGWIRSNDLTTLLIPGVPQEVRLGPIESSCDQYFFYENTLRGQCADPSNPLSSACRQERFYFYHLENHGDFSSLLPWNVPPAEVCESGGGSFKSGGMVILHTDLAANDEAIAPQQRWGSHFGYLIEQADGQHSLEVTINGGGNVGDAGDLFPGFCDVTKWNIDTDPDNSWWDTPNDNSGIEVLDVRNELSGSQVVFLWFPQDVPSLQFVQPPGGRSISGAFPLIYRWDDQHAGTGLTMFSQPAGEVTVDDLGVCTAGCYGGTKVNNSPISKTSPSSATETLQVPVGAGTALEDGQYRFYAFLDPRANCPGLEGDGLCENLFSPPVAASTNEGQGMLTVVHVELDVNNPQSTLLEAWVVTYVGLDECNGNGQWMVQGTASGVQRSDPSDPSSPLACASTNGQYSTINPREALTFKITGNGFVPGDRFLFVTTGFTAYSKPIEVIDGEVDPGPKALISATSSQDPDCCFPPVTITFDGSGSEDSAGDSGPGSNLVAYEWDLNDDGTVDATGSVAAFTFTNKGQFVVRLIVSEGEPNFRTGTATRTVQITNNRPVAAFTATPNAGPANLLVHFDASDSFDPDGDIVKYEWSFNAGDPKDINDKCDAPPFVADTEESDPEIDRIFQDGSFWVALRVTDNDGDQSCLTFERILSGNQLPVASFTATPEGGPIPLKVFFDGGASSDPDGDELTYTWHFEDDGTTVTTGKDATVEHEFKAVKLTGWLVILTVDDGTPGEGGTNEATVRIITTLGTGGAVKIDQVTATPSSGPSPLIVSFSASATSQNPGTLSFRWELDEVGTLKFGRNVMNEYINDTDEPITVNPKLIVSDETGAQAVQILTITVLPVGSTGPMDDPNLVAKLKVVCAANISERDCVTGEAPFTVQFSTEESAALDGSAITVEVDFGDGTPANPTLAGGVVSHTYMEPGEYEAFSLTVAEDGRQEMSNRIKITVTESAEPVASIFVDDLKGIAPFKVTFDGTGSFDPEGQPLTHTWNFGDGTPAASGPVVNHTFNAPAVYKVLLTVRDTSGATGDFEVEITVELADGMTPDGLPDVNGTPDGEPPFIGPEACGLACGATGAVQMLLMLLGMIGMRCTFRRKA